MLVRLSCAEIALSAPPVTRLKVAWPYLKWLARLIVLVFVLYGLYKVGREAQKTFALHKFSLAEFKPQWLVASCLLYLLATVPAAWFWRASLVAMHQQPGWWNAMRAYYVGHLGKYVPGKAFVVVIRAAMIGSERVDIGVAALATFVETLTLMAVGGVIAAVVLAVQFQHEKFLLFCAIGLGLCAGIPTWPPLFRRIVTLLRVTKGRPQLASAVAGLKLGFMSRGWLAMAIGWVLMGLSLWAALKALPETDANLNDLVSVLPILVASMALATVAGILSLIPGGAGVRELVVFALLKPTFGEAPAIISALTMRGISLLSEVLLSSILYTCGPTPPLPPSPPRP